MSEEAEFIEYMQIQGSTDLITKTELLVEMRQRNLAISDRTLTFYITKGIIPKAARIGSRSGVYPRIITELLALALLNRERGASIEATKQLIPLWKLIAKGAVNGDLDLAEIEYVARQHVTMADANFVVPFMMSEVLSYLAPRDRNEIIWRLKDGDEIHQSRSETFEISFVLGAEDEDGVARAIAWAQLKLPGFDDHPDLDDPRTIILGVPIGKSVEPRSLFAASVDGAPSEALAAPVPREVAVPR